MPVSDFECQIVRSQIGRYLDGGVLSPVALAGLEEHLAECPDCKATVTERRAALLGSLGKPTHAVVSMPVENPLVAAIRARAEAERPESAEPEPVATAKAAPRYAKSAAVKGNLTKPLALTGLLAVVLLGMGRLSHTATAPTAKASDAFAAESLPEAPKPRPAVKSPVRTVAAKPILAKAVAPVPRVPKGTMGDLFVSKAKANPDARESAPAPKKPAVPMVKPVVRQPRPPAKAKPATEHRAKIRHVASRRHASSRSKPSAPRSTVRVYGLDGQPLKP